MNYIYANQLLLAMLSYIYKKYLILLVAVLLIGLSLSKNLHAQSHNYNFKKFGNEYIEMLKQPGKWQTKNWLILTGIAGGTFGLMQADESARNIVRSDSSFESCLPIVIADKLGEGWGPLILGSSFLVAGILQDNTANKRFGFEVLQSLTYSLTITGMIKVAFGRARPFMNEGSSSFHPFQLNTRNYFSFPSGHTSNAFSLSTVLAAQSDNVLIKIAAYTPAVFTALARLYYDQHWTSDVFLGAAIGYFVGKFVTELHNNNNQELIIPPSQNEIRIIIHF